MHLSDRFAGFCITDAGCKELHAVCFYDCDRGDQIDLELLREKNSVLNERFSRVAINLNYEPDDLLIEPTVSYSLPKATKNWVNIYFPGAIYQDQYTTISKNSSGDGLYADFKTDEIAVVLIRDSKLLLATNLDYETPADLIWHFLNICHHYNISQQDIHLKLSGFLEKDSALYKELYQYFLHIELEEASWETAGDYPAHYFKTFNRLAQCVS